MDFFLFNLLNGLTLAALLFIVASGFTLIYGLMRVVNLAHGVFYLLGGYFGYSVATATTSFSLGLAAGGLGIAVVGLLVQKGLLRFVEGHDLRQVMLTLGLGIFLNDVILVIWGGDTFSVPAPEWLRSLAVWGDFFYPKYRLFVLAVGILTFVGLWALLKHTRLGALIRAGVDDGQMVDAMGVNINLVFSLTFMLGCALAGFGGVMGGVFLSLFPTADSEILVFGLAVVIIGGRGSLAGAALGSLLVGLLNVYGQTAFPELAYFVVFGPMAVILAFRPTGLMGSKS